MKLQPTLTTLVLTLLLVGSAQAVILEKGVRAGVDLANISGDFGDLVGFDNKAGFVGGAFVAVPLHPMVALQVEALYTMKGAKTQGTVVDNSGNVTGTFTQFFDLNYLDIPVLVRLSPSAWLVRPALYVGPSFDVSLGSRVHGGGLDTKIHNMRAVDVGWTVGGGLRWHMLGVGATADARYTRSFESLWEVPGSLEALNSALTFTLGAEW